MAHGKYNRKIKLAFRRSALAVCTIFVLAYPFTIDRTEKGTECYVLEMDGEKVGIVSDESMIKEAINNARLRLNAESESLTYVNPEYKVYKQSRLRGVNDTQDELEEAVYNVLKSDVISPKTEAYMVNIDGYTVTLASRDDVTALFEAVKAKYDKKNLFHVELVEETVNGKQVLTSQVLSATQQASNQNKVASSGKNNKKAATKKQEEKIKEGLSDIAFEENIEITKCYVDEKKITELKKAIHEVTKDKEKNQEFLHTPYSLQNTAENDQRVHIKEQMEEISMKKHMSYRLPKMEERRSREKKCKLLNHQCLVQIHHNHYQNIDNEYMLYRWC